MPERRRASAVLNSFQNRIDGLIRLDGLNQQRYRSGPGRPSRSVLSKFQMILVTEGLFIRSFTLYELFLEELFVLYARGKPTASGGTVNRYISPRNGAHAIELLKSGMTYLEWNSPDVVISRAEVYLDGGPIKNALTLYRERIVKMRRIRNAIAHNSDDAWRQYSRLVSTELRAPPLKMPEPGEFLMMTNPAASNEHFLLTYLNVLKAFAQVAAG